MKNSEHKSIQLYQSLKKYESLSENDTSPHRLDAFVKAYECVLDCLDNEHDEIIHEALEKALDQKEYTTYDHLLSLTLSAVHRITYIEKEKSYCSTLFITPYFTIPKEDQADVIHYPPISQIEDIFKKRFLEYGLIDKVSQLYLPSIKIKAEQAYSFDFSDWFRLHKEALLSYIHPENSYRYDSHISLPVSEQGDLSFFPIIINYEDDIQVEQPKICDLSQEIPFEKVLSKIEKDITNLSGTGTWTIGIPSHCENALDFGLEIQQDFALDTFFKTFMHRKDIEMAIFPLPNNELALLCWNKKNLSIESVLELNYYSETKDEFIERISKQLSFYEMPKAYVFQEYIGVDDIKQLDRFNVFNFNKEHHATIIEHSIEEDRVFH